MLKVDAIQWLSAMQRDFGLPESLKSTKEGIELSFSLELATSPSSYKLFISNETLESITDLETYLDNDVQSEIDRLNKQIK